MVQLLFFFPGMVAALRRDGGGLLCEDDPPCSRALELDGGRSKGPSSLGARGGFRRDVRDEIVRIKRE